MWDLYGQPVVLLLVVVFQKIPHSIQTLVAQLLVCLRVQSSLCLLDGCFGRLEVGVDTCVDQLANFCHAVICYFLGSTTKLGIDMLHALLVPLSE